MVGVVMILMQRPVAVRIPACPVSIFKIIILSLLAVYAFFLVGCSQNNLVAGSEEDERAFRRAQSFLREGRNNEALSAYLQVIETRRDAPESHFEAGRIYLDYLNNPIRAIYHFERYLELKPKGDKAVFVSQLIETAMKEFARKLPGQPSIGDPDRIDLLGRIDQLETENRELKRQLATREPAGQSNTLSSLTTVTNAPGTTTAAQPQRTQTTTQPASAINNNPPVPPRVYVVESGDTLSKISLKVYGNPNRWNEIFQANRDQMANANSLKIGMTLKIP